MLSTFTKHPQRLKPKEYQEEIFSAIVKSMGQHEKGFLLNTPPGKGKTMLLTGVIDYYNAENKSQNTKTLVIAPKAALLQMNLQAKLWFQMDKKEIFNFWLESKAKRNVSLTNALKDPEIRCVFTTPNIFKKEVKNDGSHTLVTFKWDMIVFDEITNSMIPARSGVLKRLLKGVVDQDKFINSVNHDTFVLAVTPTENMDNVIKHARAIFREGFHGDSIPNHLKDNVFIMKKNDPRFHDDQMGNLDMIPVVLRPTNEEAQVYKAQIESVPENPLTFYQRVKKSALHLVSIDPKTVQTECLGTHSTLKFGTLSKYELKEISLSSPPSTIMTWMLNQVITCVQNREPFAICVQSAVLVLELCVRISQLSVDVNLGCFSGFMTGDSQEDLLARLSDPHQKPENMLHGLIIHSSTAGLSHNFQMIKKVFVLEFPVNEDMKLQLFNRFHRQGCDDVEVKIPFHSGTLTEVLLKWHDDKVQCEKHVYEKLWNASKSILGNMKPLGDNVDSTRVKGLVRNALDLNYDKDLEKDPDASSDDDEDETDPDELKNKLYAMTLHQLKEEAKRRDMYGVIKGLKKKDEIVTAMHKHLTSDIDPVMSSSKEFKHPESDEPAYSELSKLSIDELKTYAKEKGLMEVVKGKKTKRDIINGIVYEHADLKEFIQTMYNKVTGTTPSEGDELLDRISNMHVYDLTKRTVEEDTDSTMTLSDDKIMSVGQLFIKNRIQDKNISLKELKEIALDNGYKDAIKGKRNKKDIIQALVAALDG